MNQVVLDQATFGGGCFWCLDAVYRLTPGVVNVVCGYAGGDKPNPTYEEVCSGTTGHAEVVQITFDKNQISFLELLEVFWQIHDPTTRNRQGADIGTQYRSIILYHNSEQKELALSSKEKAQKLFSRPIVTEIVPLVNFYPAEDYHQNFYQKHPNYPYCVFVIQPKLEKLSHLVKTLKKS
ncbi:MAG: peptide-methionine (S)-S-oxide reductase MsrA [Leptospiraceae bacterium]|nr:peptide-methionine (S)-S-oxide reductase MsrA [Leptospiraceae bacterium]MDW7975633.1 peptide-methionine (S)-S-oxide reductase MsrA [Leptospiraceae bacterium]